MTPHTTSTRRCIQRHDDEGSREEIDRLALEEPLEIRVQGRALAVTMRTPGRDRALAAGFCLTEGLLFSTDHLHGIEADADAEGQNVIAVTLTEGGAAARAAAAERSTFMSSSCGLCGKQSIDRITQTLPSPIEGRFTMPLQEIRALPDRMRAAQDTFDRTGGLHAAALFDAQGALRHLAEDVGRHNAVDKAVGAALLEGALPFDPGVLLVSGRASFEIMQKAAMAGVPIVCAVSAPSSLAAEFAAQANMTLVGFLRPPRMNVYHDTGRLA